MLDKIKKATEITKRVVNGVSEMVIDTTVAGLDKVQITPMLAWLDEKTRPETITVVCTPNGPGIDDYDAVIDTEDFMASVKSGVLIRPVLETKAATDQLDRELLTDRLIQAFEAGLQQDNRVEQKLNYLDLRDDKRTRDGAAAAINDEILDLALWAPIVTALLIVFGGAAAVGPVLTLMIALGGFKIVLKLPNLFIGIVKVALHPDAPDAEQQMEEIAQQLSQHRPLLQRLVADMEIEVDEDLVLERQTFE